MKVLAGTDIITRRGVFHICLQWQPRDIWYGLYIDTWATGLKAVYLCLVPCLPIHVKWAPPLGDSIDYTRRAYDHSPLLFSKWKG
jgi:hypothetical protein